jgi:hypothetical protein
VENANGAAAGAWEAVGIEVVEVAEENERAGENVDAEAVEGSAKERE